MPEKNEYCCFKCGKKFTGLGGLAMFMPEMGQMQWCKECSPVVSLEEALEMIDRFANPPKEPGKRRKQA
jgi:hypothetical protein